MFDVPKYKIELKNIKWFKEPVDIYGVKPKMDHFKKKKNVTCGGG